MKAKVKRTGQIVEVMTAFDHRDGAPAIVYEVLGHPEIKYSPGELEFYVTFDYIEEVVSEIQTVNIGYWEQLKHKYAGMVLLGLMSILPQIAGIEGRSKQTEVVDIATSVAHALVEKMKQEREG